MFESPYEYLDSRCSLWVRHPPAQQGAVGTRLEGEGERLLEQLADSGEEPRAVRAVEDAVVADERRGHHVARDDPAAVFDHGLLLEGAHGEQRSLRRVDHGGEAIDPV